MTPRITYVHAREAATGGADAANAVAEACGSTAEALVVIRNCISAGAFIEYLRSASLQDENGRPYPPLVVFLHVSPFVESGDLLTPAVTKSLGAGAKRVFIILVSNADGGVALQSVLLSSLPELARTNGLGGMTYWPYKIAGNLGILRDAVARIRKCFADAGNSLPEFDDFRRAVLPEEVIVRDLCGALSRAIHGLENLAVPLRRDAAYLSETVKPDSVVDKNMADQYFGASGYLAAGDTPGSLISKAVGYLQELARQEHQQIRDALANYSQEGIVDPQKVGDALLTNEDMQRFDASSPIDACKTGVVLESVARKIRALAETLREIRKSVERLEE